MGRLASNALVRLVMRGGVVAAEEWYLHELHERIRGVRQENDRYI